MYRQLVDLIRAITDHMFRLSLTGVLHKCYNTNVYTANEGCELLALSLVREEITTADTYRPGYPR